MAEVIDFGTGLAQSEGAGVAEESSTALLPAKKKAAKPIPWGVVNRLTENFYLIYGTDTVYDNETKRIMLIKNLRNIFGDAVKFWADSPSRKMGEPQVMAHRHRGDDHDHRPGDARGPQPRH